MFDPVQVNHTADRKPVDFFKDQLDEEQYAQHYGSVVVLPSPWNKFSLWLGKLLIRIGEKLTGECPPVEFSRENA